MNAIGLDDSEHNRTCRVRASASTVSKLNGKTQRRNVVAYEKTFIAIPNVRPVTWQVAVGVDETIIARRDVLKAVVALCRSGTITTQARRSNVGICMQLD